MYVLIVILIVMLNSSDVMSLLMYRIGLEPTIYFFIVTFFIFLLSILKNKKMSINSFFLIIILTIYLIAQFIHAFSRDVFFVSSLSTVTGFLALYSIFHLIRNYSINKLILIIYHVTLVSIVLLTSLDLLNVLIGGGSLAILTQNNLCMIGISVCVCNMYAPVIQLNKKQLNFINCLFVLFIIEIFLSVEFSRGYVRLQYKSLIVSFISLVVLFFLYRFKDKLPKFSVRSLGFLNIMTVIIFFILAVFFFNVVYDEIIPYLPRAGSGMIRFEVAKTMTDELFSGSGYLFGFGSGASEKKFVISYYKNIVDYGIHSGLMGFFYDNGVVGLLMLLTFILKGISVFKSRNVGEILIPNNYRMLSSMILIFLIAVWIYYNSVYVMAIPSYIPYYFFQTPIFILLFDFLSKTISFTKVH